MPLFSTKEEEVIIFIRTMEFRNTSLGRYLQTFLKSNCKNLGHCIDFCSLPLKNNTNKQKTKASYSKNRDDQILNHYIIFQNEDLFLDLQVISTHNSILDP